MPQFLALVCWVEEEAELKGCFAYLPRCRDSGDIYPFIVHSHHLINSLWRIVNRRRNLLDRSAGDKTVEAGVLGRYVGEN
jgi:hypothetical protein